jgi:hypothetical protein
MALLEPCLWRSSQCVAVHRVSGGCWMVLVVLPHWCRSYIRRNVLPCTDAHSASRAIVKLTNRQQAPHGVPMVRR